MKCELKKVLSFADPSKRAARRHFKIKTLGGAILYGPPGNSKTRLVMAAASSYGLPVISLSSADIYSPYVGDAEAEIRKAFSIARQGSPCILFFDEIDALVSNRGFSSGNSTNSVESRVLSTLLNEMDGISVNMDTEVIVFAATNRIDCIDKALLRKGRFNHVLHVPKPSIDDSYRLLDYFMQKCQLSENEEIVTRLRQKITDSVGLSGAEIENICQQEKLNQIQIHLNSQCSK